MVRYSFIALTIIATAATAIAAAQPTATTIVQATANVTVVQKNSPFPVVGPITVEECAVEDCSDVQS